MGRPIALITLTSAAALALRDAGLTTKEAVADHVSRIIVEQNQELINAKAAAKAAKEAEYEAIRGMINGQEFLKMFGLEIVETEPGSGRWQTEQTTETVKQDGYRKETVKTVRVVSGPWSAKYVAVQHAIRIAADLYWDLKCKLEDKIERQEQSQSFDGF